MFSDWQELHGDRLHADDGAIVAGLARLDDRPVAVIGHQKGRDIKQRQFRNFGYARPEGYRKAGRVMKMAAKFGLPIVTLIDTAGAAADVSADERGISEAIARSMFDMATLPVPIVAVIIGEGGSGGALGLAVADRVLMLEHAIYSVIAPEGCAAILWRDPEMKAQAADQLNLTAQRARGTGHRDDIIPEPLGGAHRDWEAAAAHSQEGRSGATWTGSGTSRPPLICRRRGTKNSGGWDGSGKTRPARPAARPPEMAQLKYQRPTGTHDLYPGADKWVDDSDRCAALEDVFRHLCRLYGYGESPHPRLRVDGSLHPLHR